MKKHLLYVAIVLYILTFIGNTRAEGSNPGLVNDGPYIFNLQNKYVAKWVQNNTLFTKKINQDNFSDIKSKFNLLFEYEDLKKLFQLKTDFKQTYTGVDSIAAITDIHGAYGTYINLLKSQGVVDSDLNWKFGTGHLVVIGDTFDRGDMVTEILWHLFGLEKQAAKAGGMVHMLLGNHENMNLTKDLRYMNEKYVRVEEITATKYYDLYSPGSVLGHWLRLQPSIISINDIIFVHGGISIEMVRKKMKIEHINRLFSNMLFEKEIQSDIEFENLQFLNEDSGPIWYRGFFTDENYCVTKIDSILNFYATKHIIVGHTTSSDIRTLFDKKVFGIDTGIGNDQPGAMLIYKNGVFYKGLSPYKRIEL
jgi:hypothetical protein